MKKLFYFISFIFLFAQCLHAAGSDSLEVAVTFDDLPVVSRTDFTYDTKLQITEKLLTKLKAFSIPAIGFVNETHVYEDNKINSNLKALLESWVEAGLELGNHTFSHSDMHAIPLEKYEEDILKGEIITKSIYKKNDGEFRYFRHPYLHTGRSIEAKKELSEFLKNNNYKIAPVTIDNSEWIFAMAYDNAITANDSVLAKKVAGAYIPYMKSKFEYFEKNASKLFNRKIKQILLLHANRLNADYVYELAKMIKELGYKFITITEALKDPVYESEDKYIGKGGISWLDRWALAKGFKGEFFKDEPVTPQFVLKAAGVDSE